MRISGDSSNGTFIILSPLAFRGQGRKQACSIKDRFLEGPPLASRKVLSEFEPGPLERQLRRRFRCQPPTLLEEARLLEPLELLRQPMVRAYEMTQLRHALLWAHLLAQEAVPH